MATKSESKNFGDVPVEKLKKRWKESKAYRQKYEALWDKARDYYDGKQWGAGTKIAWYQSEPVYNKCSEFVDTMRGYLSDNKWGIDAIPIGAPAEISETELMANADKVNKLLDFLWYDNRIQNKLAQVLQYVFMYGTGFMKSTFDPDNIGDGGIGQIETTVLSPWYIFPDPDSTCIQDASYVIEHHPVTLRWVIERYPDRAQEVKDSGETSTTEFYERKGDGARGPATSEEGRRLDILECWYRDSSVLEDEEGQIKLQYPNGRHTLMTAEGTILEDGPCMYTMFPYIRFVDIPRPAEFFGDCTLHKALGIQETINSLLRSIIDNGLWLVHGIWVVDSTSGVTPKTLAGYGPRATVVKNPGTEVRRDSGEALPQHLFETLNSQVTAFDRVVGFPDILRGIVPSRQPVQTVMLQQESGEVRTRERQRRVEEALADLGTTWIDIVSTHWNDKRTISSKKFLGGFDMFDIQKADFEKWRWQVAIVPGSTAPMDKQAIMTSLVEAVEKLGVAVPPEYVVKMLNLPGLEQAMGEQERVASEQESAGEGAAEAQPEPEQPPMEQAPVPDLSQMQDPSMAIPPSPVPVPPIDLSGLA